MSDLVERVAKSIYETVHIAKDGFIVIPWGSGGMELEKEQVFCRKLAKAAIEATEPADRIAALEAENKRLREALGEIKELPGELNLSNYDQDDVAALNASHIEAFNIADTALAQQGAE